jgi:hypothetical protein
MSIPVNVFINKTEFDFCLIVKQVKINRVKTSIGNIADIVVGVATKRTNFNPINNIVKNAKIVKLKGNLNANDVMNVIGYSNIQAKGSGKKIKINENISLTREEIMELIKRCDLKRPLSISEFDNNYKEIEKRLNELEWFFKANCKEIGEFNYADKPDAKAKKYVLNQE